MKQENLFLNQDYIIDILKNSNALLSGHFKLSSGLHSRFYIQCAKLQENPQILKTLTDLLASKISHFYPELKIDCVVGPAIGGIIPAYQLAMSMNCPKNIFAEKNPAGNFEFRRGYEIKKGLNYLVMEDVVTTGGSFTKVSNLIKQMGGNVALACSLIDRSNGLSSTFEDKFLSLLEMKIETFSQNEIPEDLKCIDAIKPGSSAPKA